MSVQASVVLATARTLLNDDAATLWTDAILFPKLQQAHKELQIKLRRSAAPLMKTFYTETLSAYTSGGAGQTGFLTPPADLISPIQLWEKAAADPVTLYALMTESDTLPNVTQAATMIWWAWVEEVVTFIGSTAARMIKMLYWRSLPLPAVNTDLINFLNGELYLAPRTGALAAGSVGEEKTMSALAALADASLGEVITSNRGRAMPSSGQTARP
jgi:hypothetical protein